MKLRALLAILAGLAAVLVVVSPAHATFPCDPNELCLYTNANYSGSQINFQQPVINQCSPLVGIFNDSISSLKNNTSRKIKLYNTGNCTKSGFFVIYPWNVDPFHNVADYNQTGYNDTFSSFMAVMV
jgi:hypothetical protein